MQGTMHANGTQGTLSCASLRPPCSYHCWGCRPIPDAPDDISGLVDALWFSYHEAPDRELTALVSAFSELVDEEELLKGHDEGGHNAFTLEHQDLVALEARPDEDDWTKPAPASTRPIFMINRYSCDMDQLVRVVTAEDQNGLYDMYRTYSRSYEVPSDVERFRNGEVTQLDWTGSLTATIPTAGEYTYDFGTGARRFSLPADHPSDADTALLVRTDSRLGGG